MSEHTKGPWTIHSYPEEHFVEVKGDKGYQVVATVRFAGGDRDANASLIAAAPELLEALQQAHAQMAMAAECIEAKRYSEALVHVDTMSIRRQSIIAKAISVDAPSAPIR